MSGSSSWGWELTWYNVMLEGKVSVDISAGGGDDSDGTENEVKSGDDSVSVGGFVGGRRTTPPGSVRGPWGIDFLGEDTFSPLKLNKSHTPKKMMGAARLVLFLLR